MTYCIYHSGIKGQKWGVRRYQNPDGTLTELGKQRYASAKEGNDRAKSAYNRVIDRMDGTISDPNQLKDRLSSHFVTSSVPKKFDKAQAKAAKMYKKDRRKADKEYAKAFKRASSIGASEEDVESLHTARAKREAVGKNFTDEVVTRSIAVVDKLPAKYQDDALAWLYAKYNFD